MDEPEAMISLKLEMAISRMASAIKKLCEPAPKTELYGARIDIFEALNLINGALNKPIVLP